MWSVRDVEAHVSSRSRPFRTGPVVKVERASKVASHSTIGRSSRGGIFRCPVWDRKPGDQGILLSYTPLSRYYSNTSPSPSRNTGSLYAFTLNLVSRELLVSVFHLEQSHIATILSVDRTGKPSQSYPICEHCMATMGTASPPSRKLCRGVKHFM